MSRWGRRWGTVPPCRRWALTNPWGRRRGRSARPRALVLAAAADLFRARDPRTVTMEDVARAAGVGRATLYRRFPDVQSIAVALLDDHERRLQGRLLAGPPPPGPGAPPAARLEAFYRSMVALLEQFLPLVLGAEIGSARFGTGAYGFLPAHVRALLAEGGVPDPARLADVALAPLGAELYQRQREVLGLTPKQIGDQLAWLAHRLL